MTRPVLLLIFLLVLLPITHPSPLLSQKASQTHQQISSDGTYRRIRVPILMYHYVSEPPPDAGNLRLNLTVLPGIFRTHLQYLRDQGYNTISLYQLYEALLRGVPLPPKPVILTFDDGYSDHYTTVFPLLEEYGFSGTFFVITGHADSNHAGYLTWAQIRQMADAGMYIESHTRTHLDLRGRDHDSLVYEILGSLQSLAMHTNYQPRMFAYPAGRYDDTTLNILRRIPIWCAVTTQPGALHTSDSLLELPRLRVSGDMGISGLAHLLGIHQ